MEDIIRKQKIKALAANKHHLMSTFVNQQNCNQYTEIYQKCLQ